MSVVAVSSVLLVLLLGTPVVLAQNASSGLLQPLAAQPNPICGNYATMADESCGLVGELVLFAAGAGWTSLVSLTNTGSSPVDVDAVFAPPAGMAGANDANCPIYVSGFGPAPSVADAIFGTLYPGGSIVFSMFYPGKYNGTLDPPAMPDQLQTGSITVAVYGPDEASLETVTASGSILGPAAKRERPSHMLIPFVHEVGATASWKLAVPEARGVSFAVENISSITQAVTATLDIGAKTATFTTPLLPPTGTYVGTLTQAFRETFHPEEVPLSVGRYGSAGRGGNIAFEGIGGGQFIPLMLPGPDLDQS